MTFNFSDIDIPECDKYTSITQEEAEFLHDFLAQNDIKASLEIGMGYGASAISIMSATKGAPHYIIDPEQSKYQNIGYKNIQKLGYIKQMLFLETFSHIALPQLVSKGVVIDFAFIDGGHKFDEIFLDFYYTELLLPIGGYVCFHDTWMPSTQKVMSWILHNKKNYCYIHTPIKNIALYRKGDLDQRDWKHFCDFM